MLRGKNAIITGSTSGIGLGIAEALAQPAANVMINVYRNKLRQNYKSFPHIRLEVRVPLLECLGAEQTATASEDEATLGVLRLILPSRKFSRHRNLH